MEVIIQNISNLPIQKEKIDVDTKESLIFTQNGNMPSGVLHLGGKMYVYVDFQFKVNIDKNNDYWIIPK